MAIGAIRALHNAQRSMEILIDRIEMAGRPSMNSFPIPCFSGKVHGELTNKELFICGKVVS